MAHRDCLPHLRQPNVIYFVTFRLADSLPQEKIRILRARRDHWHEVNPPPHTPEQVREYHTIWTMPLERLGDTGWGSCVLRPALWRAAVAQTLRRGDPDRYRLGAYVIMPNHVHALVQVHTRSQLSEIVQAWKSISAKAINKARNVTGRVWQPEYFDHIVRDRAAYLRLDQYIRNNPKHLPRGDFTLDQGNLTVA